MVFDLPDFGSPFTARAGDTGRVNNETLTVLDNRTTLFSTIKDSTVFATAFKAIAAPFKLGEPVEYETPKGLCVSDKGFLNTAIIQSRITYIDGEGGVLRYPGYPRAS
ncbi:hypothetical protein BGW80DRAFT_1456485 [Lactifluus volemus]|nr:hypothetical protein BGW80DRAFT_1456485 [Lactifluus volemus]